jgi:hypothetical protein
MPEAPDPRRGAHPMSGKRGREARLKPQYTALYPGLQPDVWVPVETLIRQVTDLIHEDPSRSPLITGPRLLHQEHFEYRGNSARPEGLPEGATRLSDSGVDPGQATPTGPLASQPSPKRGSTP